MNFIAEGNTDTNKKKKSRPNQGLNIIKLRGFKRMSQKDLAEKIGISPDTLRKWECMEILEENALKKVAKGLNVEPSFIEDTELDDHFAPVTVGNISGDHNLIGNKNVSYNVSNPSNQKAIKELIATLQKTTTERDVLIKSLASITEHNEILKKEIEKLKNS